MDLPTAVLPADLDALDGLARVPGPPLPVRAVAALDFAGDFFAAAVLRAAVLPATVRALVDLPADEAVRAWLRLADFAPAPAAVVRVEACLPAAGIVAADRVEADFVAVPFFAAAFAGAAPAAVDLPDADRVDAVLPAARPELAAAELLLPVPALPVAAFPVAAVFVAGLFAPGFFAADLRGLVVAMRVSRRKSPSAATCPR